MLNMSALQNVKHVSQVQAEIIRFFLFLQKNIKQPANRKAEFTNDRISQSRFGDIPQIIQCKRYPNKYRSEASEHTRSFRSKRQNALGCNRAEMLSKCSFEERGCNQIAMCTQTVAKLEVAKFLPCKPKRTQIESNGALPIATSSLKFMSFQIHVSSSCPHKVEKVFVFCSMPSKDSISAPPCSRHPS